MSETTSAVISEVKRRTGRDVVVSPSPGLQTISTVKMAGGSLPAHVIRYRPDAAAHVDYLIVVHCGFILRGFEKEHEAQVIVPSDRGKADVAKLVAAAPFVGQLGLGEPQLNQLRDQFLNGLIIHLRSIPIGMRVDAWIRQDYPDLAAMQKTVVARQIQENQGTLAASVRQMVPSRIFDATAAINAAFALFWSAAWKEDALVLPYRAAGYEQVGRRLLAIFEEVPGAASGDRELVNRWADVLGLKDWYSWVNLPA